MKKVLAGQHPESHQVSQVSLRGHPWAVLGKLIMLEGKVGAASRLSHGPGASACISYCPHVLCILSPRQS